MTLVTVCAAALLGLAQAAGKYRGLEFIEPCARSDPEIEACLARAANALADNFRHGEFGQLGGEGCRLVIGRLSSKVWKDF